MKDARDVSHILNPKVLGVEVIRDLYNMDRNFFETKAEYSDIVAILEQAQGLDPYMKPNPKVSSAEVIMIAKILCAGSKFICPLIERL